MQTMRKRTSIGGIFPLVVPRAGATPRHGTVAGKASATVAILYGQDKKIVVAMADGNYGVSITNAAEELVGFIYRMHLQPLGVGIDDIRWIYRDSDGRGKWDEILPKLVHGTTVYAVHYRPLGGRSLTDALSVMSAEGVSLSEDETSALGEVLGLEQVTYCPA